MTGVKVKVVQGAVVYHDGRAWHTGHELVVSTADAMSLVEQGVAELVDKPKRKRG